MPNLILGPNWKSSQFPTVGDLGRKDELGRSPADKSIKTSPITHVREWPEVSVGRSPAEKTRKTSLITQVRE